MYTDILSVKERVDTVCAVATTISVSEVQAMVNELNRMESFMPIMDPSGWRNISKTIDGHKTVAVAFLKFRIALDSVVEKGEEHV